MTNPRTPENTAAQPPAAHALASLALALGGEDPTTYITDQERAGQGQLVHSDVLPVDAPWDRLEALGFRPGPDVEGDPLFRQATLPEGWSRQGSSHAMWSHVVDERGVKRVAIFYKGAWYDRDARAHVERPGSAFATEAIYGDGPAALPSLWPVLTEEERDDFRASLADYEQRADEYPTIYGDRLPRVQALRQLLDAS